MANFFTKSDTETYPIGVDYTGKAPSGATLSSGVWSVTDLGDGSTVTSTLVTSATATIDGMVAKCRVQNGTLGHHYRLAVDATFDTGDVLTDTIDMLITEAG